MTKKNKIKSPAIDIKIESKTVVAHTRKLKTRWSVETMADITIKAKKKTLKDKLLDELLPKDDKYSEGFNFDDFGDAIEKSGGIKKWNKNDKEK
jgi:hypothetical protein